jgi:lipid II:glycine glycyltransferase (peptidoglycan interpeptide bridge formation enzyme)
MIRHAVEHGYRWFDFNPSGGHEGVQKFKARFGTVPLSCPMILHQTPVNRAFQQLALFRSFVMNGRGRFAFAGRR